MELIIPNDVYRKIMYWVQLATTEVSGFGKIIHNEEDQTFTVQDVYLLEQEVGGAHTDIDAKSLGKLMYATRKDKGDLRFWWHSHVNMGVFWSGTDTDTIKQLAEQGWIVASVFNKREEVRSAVGFRVEGKFGWDVKVVDEIQTTIDIPLHKNAKAWEKEFNEKVKTSSSKYNQSSFLDNNYKYEYTDTEFENDYGWYGLGLKEEAKILGMSPEKYKRMLEQANQQNLDWIESKLEAHVTKEEKRNGPIHPYTPV